jgi:hypothetical protein
MKRSVIVLTGALAVVLVAVVSFVIVASLCL